MMLVYASISSIFCCLNIQLFQSPLIATSTTWLFSMTNNANSKVKTRSLKYPVVAYWEITLIARTKSLHKIHSIKLPWKPPISLNQPRNLKSNLCLYLEKKYIAIYNDAGEPVTTI